jgi:hypothetical protein
MSEELSSDKKTTTKGRTWADVFVGATYLTGGLIFLILMGFSIYFLLGELPDWFFLSIIASVIFVPFLMERAKDGSELFLIADQPFKLTEYRVGKKVGLEIDGVGVGFQSKTGVRRLVLTSFDESTKKARGSPFGALTPIDQARDMNTLQKMTEMLENTLKESRISAQTVGIEVEKQSIEIVDWALKTIYGSIIPTEISEAFGVEDDGVELDVSLTEEEVLEGLE